MQVERYIIRIVVAYYYNLVIRKGKILGIASGLLVSRGQGRSETKNTLSSSAARRCKGNRHFNMSEIHFGSCFTRNLQIYF